MNELLSIQIPLRFLGTRAQCAERRAPEWWGRAAQAAFLNLLRREDPALSAELHEMNRRHPYTVSTLIGCPDSAFPSGGDGENLSIRVTSLNAEASEIIRRSVEPGGALSQGNKIELDYLPFEILPPAEKTERTLTSFADLARYGEALSDDPAFAFRFLSPVAFRSEGRTDILPLPGLLFQSLMNAWNEFAPIPIPADLLSFVEQNVSVSAFRLTTQVVPLKQKGLRAGAVGSIRYRARISDPDALGALHTLSAFARYSGVGSGTAFGLGQVRDENSYNL